MELSVIVPVYKIEEHYLRNCLESLHRQDALDVEFIVIDDGSPDNCGEICDEFKKIDDRFIVIHTSNLGVSHARNVGIENASGKWIVFVDGDDFIEDDLCTKCISSLNNSDSDLMLFMYSTTKFPELKSKETGVRRCLNDEEIKKVKVSPISHDEPYTNFFIGAPWGKVFKHDIIKENNIRYVLGLKKCQDRVFVYDYLQCCKDISLYYYHGYHYVDDNATSIINRFNPNIIQILNFAEDEIENRIKNQNEFYKHAYYQMCLRFLATILNLYFLNKKNEKSDSEIASEIKSLLKNTRYVNALRYGSPQILGKKMTIIMFLLKHHHYLAAIRISRFM